MPFVTLKYTFYFAKILHKLLGAIVVAFPTYHVIVYILCKQ